MFLIKLPGLCMLQRRAEDTVHARADMSMALLSSSVLSDAAIYDAPRSSSNNTPQTLYESLATDPPYDAHAYDPIGHSKPSISSSIAKSLLLLYKVRTRVIHHQTTRQDSTTLIAQWC